MKETPLTLSIEKAINTKLKAVDALIKELVEPLTKVGSPEELIKKPYESWTPEDLMLLSKIYGTVEPNPLSNLIFRKTYEKVKSIEQEEI